MALNKIEIPSPIQKRKEELLDDITSCDRLLKRHPKVANTHYVKANSYFELANLIAPFDESESKNHFQSALNSIDSAIKNDDLSVMYHLKRARINWGLNNKVEASGDFDNALNIAKDSDYKFTEEATNSFQKMSVNIELKSIRELIKNPNSKEEKSDKKESDDVEEVLPGPNIKNS